MAIVSCETFISSLVVYVHVCVHSDNHVQTRSSVVKELPAYSPCNLKIPVFLSILNKYLDMSLMTILVSNTLVFHL